MPTDSRGPSVPSEDVPRTEVHLRDIALRGFRRADGLFDLEGRLTDRKSEAFQVSVGPLVAPMALIHDIRVRLTIDLEMRVVVATAFSEVTPYPVCTSAAESLAALLGTDMSRGWSKTVRECTGGSRGCTHMREVLLALGPLAFQTLVPYRRAHTDTSGREGRPVLLDTCIAFDPSSPVVAARWPQHHRPKGS